MKWEGGMQFASEALSASTQVLLARKVLTPADGVVLCHCPAYLFTVSGLCKEFSSVWLYLILSAVAIGVRNIPHLYARYEQIFS